MPAPLPRRTAGKRDTERRDDARPPKEHIARVADAVRTWAEDPTTTGGHRDR